MKQVKLAELANKAGVSPTTVSRALNKSGYVSEEVSKRIERAIEETGYIHPVKTKHVHRDKLVGVITLHSALSPYLGELTQMIHDKAEENGYYALQVSTSNLGNAELRYHVNRLALIGVCGLIICSFNAPNLESETQEILFKSNIPVVFLERAPDCYGFNCVLVDNKLGTYTATRYLIDRGHSHLAYISLAKKMDVEVSRTNGFLKAIEQEPKGSLTYHLLQCKTISPSDAAEALKEAIVKDPQISGVITWNDVYAAGAVQYFERIGRHVPEDVEVIGYDNVLAPHLVLPLSSVAMPIEEIASAAIEIIKRNQKDSSTPRTITLEPHLVIQNNGRHSLDKP